MLIANHFMYVYLPVNLIIAAEIYITVSTQVKQGADEPRYNDTTYDSKIQFHCFTRYNVTPAIST